MAVFRPLGLHSNLCFFTAAKSSILQKSTNFIWRQKLKMQETLPTLRLFYIKINYSKMVSNTSESHAITWNCYIVHKYWCFMFVACWSMRLKPCTFTHDGINEITRPEYTQISLKSFVLCWSGYFVDSIKCLHVYGVNFMDEQAANIKLVSSASIYTQCKNVRSLHGILTIRCSLTIFNMIAVRFIFCWGLLIK